MLATVDVLAHANQADFELWVAERPTAQETTATESLVRTVQWLGVGCCCCCVSLGQTLNRPFAEKSDSKNTATESMLIWCGVGTVWDQTPST